MERDSQPFRDQDRANIATVRFQRSAPAAIIASRCSFCSRGAGASNKFEIKIAITNQIANPTRCSSAEATFPITSRLACFGSIEPDKPYIRLLVINANGVAIDHANITGVDWCWQYWQRQCDETEKNCGRQLPVVGHFIPPRVAGLAADGSIIVPKHCRPRHHQPVGRYLSARISSSRVRGFEL